MDRRELQVAARYEVERTWRQLRQGPPAAPQLEQLPEAPIGGRDAQPQPAAGDAFHPRDGGSDAPSVGSKPE
jgi:hypothetical protein